MLAKEISELPSPLPHIPCSWVSIWLLQPLSSRGLPSAHGVFLLPCVTSRCFYLKVKLLSKEISSLIFRRSGGLVIQWGVVLEVMD